MYTEIDVPTLRAELRQIASLVAPHLEGWAMIVPPPEEDYNQDRVFFTKDKMKFGVSFDWSSHPRNSRLNVSTWTWPEYSRLERGDVRKETIFPASLYDPKEGQPSISVAASKTPEQIAKDIKRRFLPEYERIYARCKAKADDYQAHEDKSESQWAKVCKLIGCDPKRASKYCKFGENYLTIENRNGSLHIDGYVDLERLQRGNEGARTGNGGKLLAMKTMVLHSISDREADVYIHTPMGSGQPDHEERVGRVYRTIDKYPYGSFQDPPQVVWCARDKYEGNHGDSYLDMWGAAKQLVLALGIKAVQAQ